MEVEIANNISAIIDTIPKELDATRLTFSIECVDTEGYYTDPEPVFRHKRSKIEDKYYRAVIASIMRKILNVVMKADHDHPIVTQLFKELSKWCFVTYDSSYEIHRHVSDIISSMYTILGSDKKVVIRGSLYGS